MTGIAVTLYQQASSPVAAAVRSAHSGRLDFSNRRITVSTCGLVPQMLELGEKTDVNLAISLHAADDETRARLMPVNRRYPLAVLIDAAKRYRQKRRKRVMFEYTLLSGVNDSDEDARRLAKLLREVRCKINLLAVNPAEGNKFQSPGSLIGRASCRERV